MTRREEIEQQAEMFRQPYRGSGNYSTSMDIKNAFQAGAKWADKTMIEKVCEWIESYLFDIGFPDDWCRDSANLKSGKQRFIEAMEE